MSADALSQEEIDALLKGASEGEVPGSGEAGDGNGLSPEDLEGLRKYGELMAKTQGEMIGTFLAQSVECKSLQPGLLTANTITETISGDVVVGSFSYSGGVQGSTALVFKQEDATRIGGTMVGDTSAAEFSEMIADAFKEVLNTILGNLKTGLSEAVGESVQVGELNLEAVAADGETLAKSVGGDTDIVVLPFELSMGEDQKMECWQVFAVPTVHSLATKLGAPKPAPDLPMETPSPSQPHAAPVQFEPLSEEPRGTAPPNLELIMDIGLEVRVELGRTQMKIRDVLNLGGGSVVELDKLAGEPVDLLINDVIFAKGEVVVIDENFGVRITDILSLNERIKTLGERSES